ncbi:MAG: heme exporter protein CcmB [Gammaproteobacteria bacterium]|nr:heme exporter protein CcmB [Gammaproteobacteria bacterium]
MSPYLYILKTDLLLAFRHPVRIVEPFAFFVLCIFSWTFATSSSNGATVVWVTALLSSVISAPQLFHTEYDEGGIEQHLLSSLPLYGIILAKVFSHWLITQLPFILSIPVWGVFLNVGGLTLFWMSVALLLGTPILSFVSALGAVAVLGIRRGSGLVALVIMPLMLPTLVLGMSIVEATTPEGIKSLLALLAALLVFTILFFPWAIGALLKVQVE